MEQTHLHPGSPTEGDLGKVEDNNVAVVGGQHSDEFFVGNEPDADAADEEQGLLALVGISLPALPLVVRLPVERRPLEAAGSEDCPADEVRGEVR